MIRLFEATVAAVTYPGAAHVDFLAGGGAQPERLRLHNAGAIAAYLSRDGVGDHDYLPAGATTEYRWLGVGVSALWLRLASAGASAVKVVEW